MRKKIGFEKKADNTFYMVAKDKDELIGIGKMKVFLPILPRFAMFTLRTKVLKCLPTE
ncbi:MAG: hypothetical protein L6V93_01080 [Clostridiales bacterium]|nr:MAG: hypothetical protein L6V93_01080 [Clostridiales bacterium]